MSSDAVHRSVRARPVRTANDRLKSRWNGWLALSVALAAASHAAALVVWPGWEAPAGRGPSPEAPRVVSLRVPGVREAAPAPAQIARAALPTVDDLRIDLALDASPPPLALADPAVDEVVVPILTTPRDEWVDYESFAPILVAPAIRNRGEMRTFLERHYPPILEFSGAQGVVQLHFWIDEQGGVFRTEVARSSGHRSLDRLAIRLSRILRFSPAMRLGRPVRVLVRLPISFRHT